jgi:3-deoxy-D-manno-octulosonic-acid transferase
METELWPNLHEYCYNYGIRVVIINGRMSHKTMNAKGWMRHLIARSIEYTHTILARTQLDKDHFLERAAREEKVKVLGNLKYATVPTEQAEPINLNKPYVLAASTHDDEEFQLAKMWRQLGIDSHLLVIVPRHPKRLSAILKQLDSLGLATAVRSRGEQPAENTRLYIADTFGELGGFIAGADFTFMGGSLVPVGGHNILEVARAGKAVIFGPQMSAFHDECNAFLQQQAGRQVQDVNELGEVVKQWLADPTQPARLGNNARQLVAAQQHVLDDYLEALTALVTEQD